MPGAQWLELLCRHIPDRYEPLVRYLGWYSNRARGERAKLPKVQQTANTSTAVLEPESEFAARARAAWTRLIRKVYEADPLECPKCKGPMRVIALIDDPHVVRRILEHLGRWAPEPAERDPPAQAPEWPANAVIPLTYHPVPDIAHCLHVGSGDPTRKTPACRISARPESARNRCNRQKTSNEPDRFSYPSMAQRIEGTGSSTSAFFLYVIAE